jgi:glycosyltransferase involved in cell wall biosynthesis
MPLAMLEAMAMSRMVIVSTAGGNAEIVTDGVNGFIGECGEQSFEAAMERAWEQRAHWPAIAEKARETVLREVPAKPEQTFANLLLAAIAND